MPVGQLCHTCTQNAALFLKVDGTRLQASQSLMNMQVLVCVHVLVLQDRIGRNMIDDAEAKGLITPGGPGIGGQEAAATSKLVLKAATRSSADREAATSRQYQAAATSRQYQAAATSRQSGAGSVRASSVLW